MRNGTKVAVIGGVFAVMVGGAGYGAYNIVNALGGDGGSGSAGTPVARTGLPSAEEVKETTRKFFAAWEKGQATEAASYTNYAGAAEGLLASYRDEAHIRDVRITEGTTSGRTVRFSVKATVSYE